MKQYIKQSSSDRYEKTMSCILTDKLQPQGLCFHGWIYVGKTLWLIGDHVMHCALNDWPTSLYHIQFYLLLQILVCCRETFFPSERLFFIQETLFDAQRNFVSGFVHSRKLNFSFLSLQGHGTTLLFGGKTIHYAKFSLTLWQHRASLPITRTINWLSQSARFDRVCYLWQINVIFVATSYLGLHLVIWLERQVRPIFKHSLTCHNATASWAKKTIILPHEGCMIPDIIIPI